MLNFNMSFVFKIIRNVSYYKYRNSKTLVRVTSAMPSCRNFNSNNTRLCVKMFLEHENKYAYNIMESQGYAITLHNEPANKEIDKEEFERLLQKNWAMEPPQSMYEAFHKFAIYSKKHGLCITQKTFDSFIDVLTDNLKFASDKELQSIFYAFNVWPETPSIRSRNLIEVWAALDDECINRLKGWTYDEMLSFVSLFYMINVTKFSEFSNKCIQKMASKAKNLNSAQLTQTLFFISIYRRAPIDMHNIEIQLECLFTKFSLDDLAVMSMGFFKSKTPIRSKELILKIIDKIIEDSKNIHEVSLAALLKVIRYSMKLYNDKIYDLLETLQHEVPRLSVMCNVHLALVGTATLTFHKSCLTKIADAVIESVSTTRLKDIERLILTFGTFNFIPPTKECFIEKVIEEFKKPTRDNEILHHGRSFACCISYLGLLGSFPVDLIDKTLSKDFLLNTYGKQVFGYGRETLTLHNYSLIFCGDSGMNRLDDKAAMILAKRYTDFVPKDDYPKQYNVTERMFLDVMGVLREIQGGTEFVFGDHILTHHQRGDIIICNDPDGNPQPVEEKLKSQKFGLVKYPPDNNLWIVFIIAGRNAIIQDMGSVTGPFLTKVKELRQLGFYPVLVPWNVYSPIQFSGSMHEKTKYLNSLIKTAVGK